MSQAGWRKLVWVLATIALHYRFVSDCCEEKERFALLEIKAYMKSSYLKYGKINWPDDERHNCCTWTMVECDTSNGRVTQLHLSNMVENNDIQMNPPWLFNLTLFRPFSQLTSLDLSFNCINGLIGHNDLRELQVLAISNNNFDTSLQDLLPNITSLEKVQVLHFNDNSFYGPIQGLCSLKNLMELRLTNNLFYGIFPSCLQNLSALQTLDLSYNQLYGKLPEVFSNLGDLEYLDLSNNHFQAKFSLTSLANLSKLEVLRLSRNKLQVDLGDSKRPPAYQLQKLGLRGCNLKNVSETFTRFYSHQTNLSELDLSDNAPMEAFPASLLGNSKLRVLFLANNSFQGSLKLHNSCNLSLQILDISNNNFHDKLPENIGLVFPQLQYVNLSGNHFQGHIPNSIVHMSQLQHLDFSNNYFSGELPRGFLSISESLFSLNLFDNNIEGDVISEDMNLPNLEWLNLRNNNFGGTIQDGLRKSSFLYFMDISNNNVTGTLPWWLGNFSSLYSLSMAQNNLQGQIPKEIIADVLYLDLSGNNFTGSIPSGKNLCSLVYLHLHGNHLSGEIPNTLSSCSMLATLDLRDNQLSGGVPLWIDKLSSLTILLLAGNNLHGPIPQQLCELRNINILDISRNRLEGSIPICFGNLSFGMNLAMYENTSIDTYYWDDYIEFDFYDVPDEAELIDKNDPLSYKGRNLVLMSGLDLSCNKLTGDIPTQLGNLKKIQFLNMSHNCFSGQIPGQFSDLKEIESLDLSYNNLSGAIPSQLVELNFLAIFNVSYNNLSGRVPETGQFANFDESNYMGNPGLYGFRVSESDNQTKTLPPDATEEDDDGGIEMVDFVWSFVMSCVVVFLATVAILYINPQWCDALLNFVVLHILWWLPSLY